MLSGEKKEVKSVEHMLRSCPELSSQIPMFVLFQSLTELSGNDRETRFEDTHLEYLVAYVCWTDQLPLQPKVWFARS